jgi:hypothetical protein
MQRAAAQGVHVSTGDKRRAGRVLSRSQIQLVYEGANITANLADVSHRGLSLFSHTRMKCGDTFILRLCSDSAPAQILCTVVHCHSINLQIFKIGAEFTCTLPSPPDQKPAANATQKQSAQAVQDEVARIQHSILD